MSEIRAAVFPRPHAPVELRTFREPELEPGAAAMRVLYSEVCGTDVHLHEGRLAGVPYPLIPGHVSVGYLERIRGELRSVEGRALREGDLVTFLDVHRTCHACWYCLVARASTRCPQRRVYGITYGASDGLCGGWAEKIHLKPGTLVIPLDAAAPTTLMAGGCGLPTALHAIERADIAIGDDVLVLGTGPVGLSLIALARLRGAASVLAIGAPPSRLAAATAMGARDVLDFRGIAAPDRERWVSERTHGRGADVTIEAAGAPEAVAQAMRCTRDGGRVVVVGQYTDGGTTEINPHLDINRKHLEIRGCWGSDYVHFHRAVQIAATAGLNDAWSRMPRREYALEDVGQALADVAQGLVVKALIRP